MTAWLHEHLFAVNDAFQHVRRARGSFALNAIVIAIALALPFAGLTLMENLRAVSQRMVIEPSVSVFLAAGTSRAAGMALAPQLQRLLDESGSRGHVAFVSREAALGSLQQNSDIADAVVALGDNPLPDAYLITLASPDDPGVAARLEGLVAQLAALPGVEQVELDAAWIKRLAATLYVVRILVMLLALTLAVVVIAVAFNTIRLQVLTQREEIGVARLVGATDRFIYRPFHYAGALLGAAAGLLALAAVALMLHPLNQALAELARLYAMQFHLRPLDWPQSLLLLMSSILLGLAGSALSVRRSMAPT